MLHPFRFNYVTKCMSAWICGVCGTPTDGDACPKCMTVRPAQYDGMNPPTSYASLIAGTGSRPKASSLQNAWQIIVIVSGGLILLAALIAQWR